MKICSNIVVIRHLLTQLLLVLPSDLLGDNLLLCYYMLIPNCIHIFLFSGLSSNLILPWFFEWFGNPNNPSYMVDMNMELSHNMNFFERLENTICQLYYTLGHEYVLLPTANKYSKKYLGFDLEANRDIFYNVSLLFSPTHFTSFGAHPLVPSIIEVGGIHISPPNELPKVKSCYFVHYEFNNIC